MLRCARDTRRIHAEKATRHTDPTSSREKLCSPGRMNEKTRFMLALIAPAALVLVLFQVVPILTGANASFRDWTLHDPKRTWVGSRQLHPRAPRR